MQRGLNQARTGTPRLAVQAFLWSVLALLSAAVAPSAFSQVGQVGTPLPQKPTNQAEPKPSGSLRPDARLPDANDVMKMRAQQVKNAKFEAANIERKRQLDEDSLALLKLAAEFNDDIEKNDHKLTQDLMRKTEQIERLAHNVQVKMKLTMSAAN